MELDSAKRTRQHGGMTDQIARIRITLEDMKPAIWRRVELPVTNSLKTLHLAIQACMLFENYHLFRFDVGDAAYGIRFDDDDAFMVRTRDAANRSTAPACPVRGSRRPKLSTAVGHDCTQAEQRTHCGSIIGRPR